MLYGIILTIIWVTHLVGRRATLSTTFMSLLSLHELHLRWKAEDLLQWLVGNRKLCFSDQFRLNVEIFQIKLLWLMQQFQSSKALFRRQTKLRAYQCLRQYWTFVSFIRLVFIVHHTLIHHHFSSSVTQQSSNKAENLFISGVCVVYTGIV